MEEDLISKKELLDFTGISYGQLYRWKRKQLIPEDWFIRKSTFTGQETFFPKERMLGRIQHILSKKDDLSLDELAGRLSDMTSVHKQLLTLQQIGERNIVSNVTLERYGQRELNGQTYSFDQLIHLVAVDRLLGKGELSLEEADLLYHTLSVNLQQFEGKNWELFFMRKMGVGFFLQAVAPAELVFDEGVRLVSRLSLADLTEQLQGKLG
ncbi:hypothetical protein D3C75_823730 [compost metagenome]